MFLALAYLEEDGIALLIAQIAGLVSLAITAAMLWRAVETVDWSTRRDGCVLGGQIAKKAAASTERASNSREGSPRRMSRAHIGRRQSGLPALRFLKPK